MRQLKPRTRSCLLINSLKIEDVAIINSKGFIALSESTASPLEDLYLSAGQAGSVVVHNSQGSYYGLLCPRTVKILGMITQDHGLRFQLFMNFEATVNTPSQRGAGLVNIYGPSNDAEEVGDLLCNQNVFLQPPPRYDAACEYRNPQCYVVPGRDTMDVIDDLEILGNRLSTREKQGSFQKTLDTLIPAANNPASRRSPDVSDLLRTPLLEHQLDSLSLMQEKEDILHGVNNYGGILADEPGLGKSLTALALVAGSLSATDTASNAVGGISTLLIVPTSLLVPWQEQIVTHIRPKGLSLYTFHGQHRTLSNVAHQNPHIVLTTYSTLVSDWASKESCLLQSHWYRVILDEAHYIKDRSTKRFKAISALKTHRRWCLTGTPLQNKIEDISGLFLFLRLAPFDDYRQFHGRIIRPLLRGDSEGLYALQAALRSVMIRHTKQIVALPPRHDIDVKLSLSSDEKALYDMARDDSLSLIGTCLKHAKYTKGFHIIQLILRQRQISNHGLHLLSSSTQAALTRRWRTKGASGSLIEELVVFCEACNLEIRAGEQNAMFEHCFHAVCVKCAYENAPEHETEGICPLCNAPEGAKKRRQPQPVSLQAWDNDLEYTGPSTKVQALLKNLRESQQDPQDGHPVKS